MPTITMRASLALIGLLIVAACGSASTGNVAAADTPPAGSIWFGEAFDPATFELKGRTTNADQGRPVVLVANVGRSVTSGDLSIRTSYNGSIVNTQPATGEGEGEIWGFQLSPMLSPGEWRYELVDIGGNALAAGTISVR